MSGTALDALLGTISHDDVELELGSGLNFKGGVELTRNADTGKIDIEVTSEGSGLPPVTTADNGDTMKVVGGVWTKVPSVDYDMLSFSADVAVVDPGSTVTNPSFSANHNRTPTTSLTLTNNKTGEAKNVLATPTAPVSSAGGQVLATPGASWVFTLTGVDFGITDSLNASIVARQRNVAGVVTVGNTSPATLYAAAVYNQFGTSGAFNFTFTDDGTHEVQFMRRAAYGTPSSVKDNVTGFAVSFSLVGSFSWTGPGGFTENMNIYKLDNPVNGTKTIAVGA
jgi:hypothetical protein